MNLRTANFYAELYAELLEAQRRRDAERTERLKRETKRPSTRRAGGDGPDVRK